MRAGDRDEAAAWAPLLQPAFLEGLWRQVRALWAAAGFAPCRQAPAGPRAGAGPLRAYLRTGRLPAAADLVPGAGGGAQALVGNLGLPQPADVAWLQELFCAFLAMTDAPRPTAAAAAARAAGQGLPARTLNANPSAQDAGSEAALPALAAYLPGTPPEALAHLAACLPLE